MWYLEEDAPGPGSSSPPHNSGNHAPLRDLIVEDDYSDCESEGEFTLDEADKPPLTAVEMFINCIDGALGHLLNWGAENWKLDSGKGDFEEQSALNDMGRMILPLLKVVKKQLKKVKKALKQFKRSIDEEDERMFETSVTLIRDYALAAKDHILVKYSRQRVQAQHKLGEMNDHFEDRQKRLDHLRRRKKIIKFLWRVFSWWWRLTVTFNIVLAAAALFAAGLWFWARESHLYKALEGGVRGAIRYALDYPYGSTFGVYWTRKCLGFVRSNWKSVTGIITAGVTTGMGIAGWRAVRQRKQELEEEKKMRQMLEMKFQKQRQQEGRRRDSVSSSSGGVITRAGRNGTQVEEIIQREESSIKSTLQTAASSLAALATGSSLPEVIVEDVDEELELEKFPAEDFMKSATDMWDGIVQTTDEMLGLVTKPEIGVMEILRQLNESASAASNFDTYFERCLRHCAALVASYDDLQEAMAYRETQEKLTRKYSAMALNEMDSDNRSEGGDGEEDEDDAYGINGATGKGGAGKGGKNGKKWKKEPSGGMYGASLLGMKGRSEDDDGSAYSSDGEESDFEPEKRGPRYGPSGEVLDDYHTYDDGSEPGNSYAESDDERDAISDSFGDLEEVMSSINNGWDTME